MTWRTRFGALPAGQRVAIVATAIVALGAGVLSWSANTWAAGEIGIDPSLAWLFGVVIDGAIAAGTAGIFELRGPARAAGWAVFLSALAVSVVDNAAHARAGGGGLHAIGSTVPAVLMALCLVVVELLVRTPRAEADQDAQEARGDVQDARARVRVLVDQAAEGRPPTGREIAQAVGVSPGHARRLRRQVTAAAGASS